MDQLSQLSPSFETQRRVQMLVKIKKYKYLRWMTKINLGQGELQLKEIHNHLAPVALQNLGIL